ncbi:MAG TPA: M28 family peptidase [Solirubrobacteraceae bacterium]|nr:M28 family peptidase [Solirubrobacteraceae bacterium]
MPPDQSRLRAVVEHLEAIDRRPASAGERRAAEWLRDQLAAEGLEARVEEEPATGSFAIPIALLSAAGAAAGLSRRARPFAALAGLAATAGIVDDVSAGPHVFRRLLPRRRTCNVVAEAGDPAAAETVVFVAHHDAANGGIVFDPGPNRWIADTFPDWYARQETSPPLMRIVVAGPALAGLGALLGRRGVRRLGGWMALASLVAMGDIAARSVVPGANDNLAAVAVLVELARLLRDEPPDGVRVLLLSTGSEESFLEGMRGFVARHAGALAPERTRFVVLECVGGPEPIVLEGEGMLRMHDYTPAVRDWLAACGERAGHRLRRGLRTGFATDALIALKAGYPTGVLAAIDEYKMAPNYHSQRDVAANVDFGTVAACAEVCLEAVRSLSRRRPAPVPAR